MYQTFRGDKFTRHQHFHKHTQYTTACEEATHRSQTYPSTAMVFYSSDELPRRFPDSHEPFLAYSGTKIYRHKTFPVFW